MRNFIFLEFQHFTRCFQAARLVILSQVCKNIGEEYCFFYYIYDYFEINKEKFYRTQSNICRQGNKKTAESYKPLM